MTVLPSRGRPLLLQRYFDEGQPEQPGVVILDLDDAHHYVDVRYPPNWSWLITHAGGGYVRKANYAFQRFPNEPWYAIGGDDSIGRTPHWDSLLAAAVTPTTIVWPNDLIAGHCTQPFVGGDLCRAVGWFCHPALRHLYCDTVWTEIQAALGIGTYLPNIILEHLHFSTGKSTYDRTSGERMQHGDKAAYADINLAALVAQLRPLCAS